MQLSPGTGGGTNISFGTFYTTEVQLSLGNSPEPVKAFCFLYHWGAIESANLEILKTISITFLYHWGAIESRKEGKGFKGDAYFLYHWGAIESRGRRHYRRKNATLSIPLRCNWVSRELNINRGQIHLSIPLRCNWVRKSWLCRFWQIYFLYHWGAIESIILKISSTFQLPFYTTEVQLSLIKPRSAKRAGEELSIPLRCNWVQGIYLPHLLSLQLSIPLRCNWVKNNGDALRPVLLLSIPLRCNWV